MLLADEKGAFKGDGGVHVSQGTVGFPFWGSPQNEELSFWALSWMGLDGLVCGLSGYMFGDSLVIIVKHSRVHGRVCFFGGEACNSSRKPCRGAIPEPHSEVLP